MQPRIFQLLPRPLQNLMHRILRPPPDITQQRHTKPLQPIQYLHHIIRPHLLQPPIPRPRPNRHRKLLHHYVLKPRVPHPPFQMRSWARQPPYTIHKREQGGNPLMNGMEGVREPSVEYHWRLKSWNSAKPRGERAVWIWEMRAGQLVMHAKRLRAKMRSKGCECVQGDSMPSTSKRRLARALGFFQSCVFWFQC